MYRMLQVAGPPAAGGEPMAELSGAVPAGRVPGRRHRERARGDPGLVRRCAASGVDHAVISADPSPGGMFRRWPFFQRLLSWTKPHAPVERGSRAYERYDWNSLLSDDPACRGHPARADGRVLVLPVAAGDGGEPRAVRGAGRRRHPLRLPLDRDPTGSRRRTATRFEVETTDGRYRCRVLIVAVGVAEPYTPPGLGMEFTHHYAEVRPVEAYADRRVLLIGKQNSGFELATGLLPWARQIVLDLAVEGAAVGRDEDAGRRPGALRPAVRGLTSWAAGSASSTRRSTGSSAADDGRLTAYLRRTDGGADLTIEVDDAISATGFVCPLRRPAGSRRRDVRGEPAARPDALVGERPGARASTSPGRSGRARRASRSTACRPTPGPSTAPATTPACWPGTIAETHFGIEPDRPHLAPGRRSPASSRPSWRRRPSSSTSAATSPACSPPTRPAGCATTGVQPLAHVLDAGGPDALAATLEGDGSGAIYPVVYTRIGGKVVEQAIEPDPLMRFDTVDARRLIAELVGRVMTR